MTSPFEIRFTRYRNGERRISNAQNFNCTNIVDAFALARSILLGMKSAQADNEEYEIASVSATGLFGIKCEGGSYMFETAEECNARLTAEASA